METIVNRETELNNLIKLIITRHGQAAHNLGEEAKHTFAGSSINNELTDQGEESTHQLADQLISQGGCDLIVHSPLLRSKQSAEIIAQDLQKKFNQEIRLVEIEDLKEIDIGDFAGQTEEDVKDHFPESAANFYQGNLPAWRFPHGENFEQVSCRVEAAFDQIKAAAKPGDRILICGHAMFNRVLFFRLDPDNQELWRERTYRHNKIVNLDLKLNRDDQ